MISAFARGGQWVNALAMLGEIRRRRHAPHIMACNSAMSACEHGHEWARALWILSGMDAQSLPPSTHSLNIGIQACLRGARWACALRMLAQAFEPDEVTYGLAANAFAAFKDRQLQGDMAKWQAAAVAAELAVPRAVRPFGGARRGTGGPTRIN
eukprot:CAMPEP_0179373972 /NCGR_PEP_ID=MMETSP0797-20121207/87066_1 /TAXON_ID=47934 /ORGANISM="Dinophysis acuminata, Strain DAEP01" /LENGTH=153 /DNA_ID=CAMNT_0021089971 /DNA_START=29 /DNA_END=488 /DNA_ORIENTATION=+